MHTSDTHDSKAECFSGNVCMLELVKYGDITTLSAN